MNSIIDLLTEPPILLFIMAHLGAGGLLILALANNDPDLLRLAIVVYIGGLAASVMLASKGL